VMEMLPKMWAEDRLVRAIGISCAGVLGGAYDTGLFPLRHA